MVVSARLKSISFVLMLVVVIQLHRFTQTVSMGENLSPLPCSQLGQLFQSTCRFVSGYIYNGGRHNFLF